MKDPLAPIDAELLRKALLRYLAMYHPSAHSTQSLALILHPRGLIDFSPSIEQTTSALALLKDLALVTEVKSPVGSSSYWAATAIGKLAVERGEI
jgi:hypothetical protein